MMTTTAPTHAMTAPSLPRTVALIGRYAHQHLHDTMHSVADCDIVVVESTARAYSRIKRVHPDVVVLCLGNDEVGGCQLLSMLALDAETSAIPVLTWADDDGSAVDEADPLADSFIVFGAAALN
jgi:DNA-binding NarL/FixJ family response regulator